MESALNLISEKKLPTSSCSLGLASLVGGPVDSGCLPVKFLGSGRELLVGAWLLLRYLTPDVTLPDSLLKFPEKMRSQHVDVRLC